MILEHTRQQLPIGQGFFHFGNITLLGQSIHYVYDCGSDNRKPLERAIQTYASELSDNPLDLLFISHLHSDHVNGLDTFLVPVKTKRAILPYLSPISRLILIAEAIEKNTLTGSYLSLLCDPTKWLTDRGVDEVIYVAPSEPPDELPPAQPDGWALPILVIHDDPDTDINQVEKEALMLRKEWGLGPAEA